MNYSTREEVKAKAEELSIQHNVKVHSVTFRGTNDEDLVVAFIKEPSFLIKARAMDKVYNGMSFTAGIEIMDTCLLKEETDPRILSDLPVNHTFKLGCAKFCGELVRYSVDLEEKKN